MPRVPRRSPCLTASTHKCDFHFCIFEAVGCYRLYHFARLVARHGSDGTVVVYHDLAHLIFCKSTLLDEKTGNVSTRFMWEGDT